MALLNKGFYLNGYTLGIEPLTKMKVHCKQHTVSSATEKLNKRVGFTQMSMSWECHATIGFSPITVKQYDIWLTTYGPTLYLSFFTNKTSEPNLRRFGWINLYNNPTDIQSHVHFLQGRDNIV